jgi:5-methylcytosine-specific restriction endonuclease McrA
MPHRTQTPSRKPPHHTGRPWRRLRIQTLERDNWQCQIPDCRMPTRDLWRSPPTRCHPMSPSVDLIHPKQHGGSDSDPTNLRAAHLGCNSRRGNQTRTPPTRWTTSTPRVGGQGGGGTT